MAKKKLCCADCGSFDIFLRHPVLYFVCAGEVRWGFESDNAMTFKEYVERVVKRIPRKVLRRDRAVVWEQGDVLLRPVAVAEDGPKGVTVRRIAA